MNTAQQKRVTAKAKPVNVEFTVPQVTPTYKALWKNELAIALLGIIITVFFSVLFYVASKKYLVLAGGVVVIILIIFLPKIPLLRKGLDKITNRWMEYKG